MCCPWTLATLGVGPWSAPAAHSKDAEHHLVLSPAPRSQNHKQSAGKVSVGSAPFAQVRHRLRAPNLCGTQPCARATRLQGWCVGAPPPGLRRALLITSVLFQLVEAWTSAMPLSFVFNKGRAVGALVSNSGGGCGRRRAQKMPCDAVAINCETHTRRGGLRARVGRQASVRDLESGGGRWLDCGLMGCGVLAHR